MLQLNTLSSRQEAYLHNLADQYAQLLPEAMAVHSLILMYDMLEALEFTHEQIESVFGPQVMLYLTGLLYGAHCAAEDIPSPLAAVPLLTINGRPVPFLGTVDPDGRIHYGLAAQTLLNGTNPPRSPHAIVRVWGHAHVPVSQRRFVNNQRKSLNV